MGPSPLPPGYGARPARLGDVAVASALLNAASVAQGGGAKFRDEGVRGAWRAGSPNRTRLIDDAHGRLAGFVDVRRCLRLQAPLEPPAGEAPVLALPIQPVAGEAAWRAIYAAGQADSANDSGALPLYERVGLKPYFVTAFFDEALPAA